ncbi:hypothetical protein GCK32_006936 [Trichostrongylus colubriformis]|uniref:Uncharacterized protein n=1 Tax=Trichostrongylus colubriformis TaxID=6319 RepID=A0AAN8EX00_TRICO
MSASRPLRLQVGATLKISLGPNVVLNVRCSTWKRLRRGGVEEFIKHCKEGESESRCSQFVTTDDEAALPKSNSAVVLANGTLIIESFVETDAGTYSSPDLKPKVKLQCENFTQSVEAVVRT